MIILDTNVVSETMKPEPDVNVLNWLDGQVSETLYLTSVTLAELLFGVAALPAGKRKNRLTAAIDGLIDLFAERTLPFDAIAARHYASLAVAARRKGRGFPAPDGYIAAIAAARGYLIASRDTAAFESAGLTVFNPWARQ
ncbi:MAG: type II toxin-antitoxin system VapC family toxin [Acidobacteriota bacterium]|jgi:predicted nucleic acid-binding protein|nr:type II toxin-antitoxin system VapC family toxin [Acidobacteriota bacterium]